MKNIFLAAAMIVLVTLSSCIKSPLSPFTVNQIGGGTWTFAGIKDTATSCIYNSGIGNQGMSGSNYKSGNLTGYTTLRCGFLDTLRSGTYTVVPTTVNIGRNQMSFEIDYGLSGSNGNSYYSTGTGANQTVNVSVSGNTVTVTGSGITIYQIPLTGNPNASDTSVLSLNLYAPYN